MGKITGTLVGIEALDETYCHLFLDVDQIWGSDEVMELKASKRLVADLLTDDETRTGEVDRLLQADKRTAGIRALNVRFQLIKE